MSKSFWPKMHPRIEADQGSFEQFCLPNDKAVAEFLKTQKLPPGAQEWQVTTCYCKR